MKQAPDPIRNCDPEHIAKTETKKPSNHPESPPSDDDTLEFVVTEAPGEGVEPVGGFETTDVEEDLGVESTADLVEKEARQGLTNNVHQNANYVSQPIGDSEPPLPGPPDTDSEAYTAPTNDIRLERLSDDQVREITDRMSQSGESSEYVTEEEKLSLIKNLGRGDGAIADRTEHADAFDSAPIVPPKKEAATSDLVTVPELKAEHPKMARRIRGVAYFTKNFIQITGEQQLHESDELTINGRNYLLKKKKISNKFLAWALAPLLAMLLFVIVTNLGSDADAGWGTVIGFVLDENGQPLLAGATVRFAELGKEYRTNAQGIFKSDPIAVGSHKIEYVRNGRVIATDYATVVDGQVTTLTIEPTELSSARTTFRTQETETTYRGAPTSPPEPPVINPNEAEKPTSSKPAAKASSRTSSGSNWAKLALAANVDNAKLTLDKSVVGAGNLTFTRLKPGRHTYTVVKEGYQTATGTINLAAGGTKRLEVNLVPITTEPEKAEAHPEQAFYNSGVSALQRGEYQIAVSDLSEAITLLPSYAEAHLARAEAYASMMDKRSAYDDCVRAAEIFSFRRSYNSATAAYNKAIELDPKAVTAYVGRGYLYLDRKEAIAAIADFDMAVSVDKRNLRSYIGLGRARYEQANYKKAIKHFKDARSIDSEDPAVHRLLMLSYFKQGDIKKARKSYEDFLKCASDNDVQTVKSDPKFNAVLSVVEN